MLSGMDIGLRTQATAESMSMAHSADVRIKCPLVLSPFD